MLVGTFSVVNTVWAWNILGFLVGGLRLRVSPQLDGKELRNVEYRLTSDLPWVTWRQKIGSGVRIPGSLFSLQN